eukprot:COSAG01_NODE_236_length_20742_cov_2129.910236_16_plen_411_part_00
MSHIFSNHSFSDYRPLLAISGVSVAAAFSLAKRISVPSNLLLPVAFGVGVGAFALSKMCAIAYSGERNTANRVLLALKGEFLDSKFVNNLGQRFNKLALSYPDSNQVDIDWPQPFSPEPIKHPYLDLDQYSSVRTAFSSASLGQIKACLDKVPGKGSREKLCDVLGQGLAVQTKDITSIQAILALLQDASLVLDDMQDGAMLRRGIPATYRLINDERKTCDFFHFLVYTALLEVKKLDEDERFKGKGIFDFTIKCLIDLIDGQLLDDRRVQACPNDETQYKRALEKKTAPLFVLLAVLLHKCSSSKFEVENLIAWGNAFGKVYQVMDDIREVYALVEGKEPYQDFKQGKKTAVDYWGREGAFAYLDSCLEELSEVPHADVGLGFVLKNVKTQRESLFKQTSELTPKLVGA